MPSSAVDWSDIMATVRAQYAAPDIELDEDGKEIEPEPAFSVVSIDENPDLSKLPKSPKAVHDKAVALGWTVTARTSLTHHEAAYLLKNGTKPRKDGTTGVKGDLKAKAKDVKHLFMHAVDPTRKVGFSATWNGTSFAHAHIQDPLGIPVELYFDYKPKKEAIAARGKEASDEIADNADREYNDGMSILARRHLFTTATEFEAWLADWMELAGIEVTRKAPRKPKEKIVTNDLDLIAAGEWSA